MTGFGRSAGVGRRRPGRREPGAGEAGIGRGDRGQVWSTPGLRHQGAALLLQCGERSQEDFKQSIVGSSLRSPRMAPALQRTGKRGAGCGGQRGEGRGLGKSGAHRRPLACCG